jgi:hypothetical protein
MPDFFLAVNPTLLEMDAVKVFEMLFVLCRCAVVHGVCLILTSLIYRM